MAEAAAAASPSPEAGQPAVEEQTQAAGGEGSGGVDEGAPGEVAPAKPRQRKERLPGVMTRDDGEDIFPELGFKSNRTGKRIGRKEAQAEADREMRQEMGLEDLDTAPIPDEQKPKEQDAPTPKKIKFADKEYGDLAEAEQSFKSLQGMFKPLNERVTRAEALAREAADNARFWRDKAEGAMRSPTPPEPNPPGAAAVRSQPNTAETADQQLQAALKNVDGEMFETLARERGLPLAGRYLAAQVLASVHDTMLPALREEIMAQINPRLEPVAQSVEFNRQAQEVGTLFERVGELRNPDGNVAFPELADEGELTEIAELWSTMDNPSPTPQSLIQAIAMYRLYRGVRGVNAPTSTPQVQVTPPANVLPRAGDASLEAGGSSGRPTTPRAGAATDDSRFARMLDETSLVDPILGFSVRRRR